MLSKNWEKLSLVPDLKVSKLSLELYMGSSYFGHLSSLSKKNQTVFFGISDSGG